MNTKAIFIPEKQTENLRSFVGHKHRYRKFHISKSKTFLFTISLIVILLATNPAALYAAIFSASSVKEIEDALANAQTNGEDDTINIAPGSYTLTNTLNYDSHEDNSITIQGGAGKVELDGNWNRVLFMRTYTPNASIRINGINLTNGYVPEGDNGGGLFVNISSGDLTIENSQITNNFAAAFYFTNHGGGAYITSGSGNVLIRNCVIANNIAKGLGGGMYLSLINGTLSFINNTVVNNLNKTSEVEGGGGIYLRLFFDAVVAHLYNNILWDNTFTHGNGDLYIEDNGDGANTASTVFMYNNDYRQLDLNLGENMTFSGNISQNPLLSTDFHLSTNSPCLDSGSPAAPNISTQDFEGDPRNVDGKCDTTSIPDIGADEYYDPPRVFTTEIFDITSTTAAAGGNVADEGGHAVTARGVCWNTDPGPTLLDTCTQDGAGAGVFVSSTTGLSEGTAYYARAYATNCEGTSYGGQKSFIATALPTVITSQITNIGSTTATGGGKVIGEGDFPVTARGTCWSKSSGPTLADSCTHNGAGPGIFSSSLTGLIEHTTYYVRAYATNAQDTSYGKEFVFYAKKKFPWLIFTPAITGNSQPEN